MLRMVAKPLVVWEPTSSRLVGAAGALASLALARVSPCDASADASLGVAGLRSRPSLLVASSENAEHPGLELSMIEPTRWPTATPRFTPHSLLTITSATVSLARQPLTESARRCEEAANAPLASNVSRVDAWNWPG